MYIDDIYIYIYIYNIYTIYVYPKGLGHVTRTGRTLLSTYPERGPC